MHFLTRGPCSWYKRSEFGIRAAIFFSAATISGAFGGLLAVCARYQRQINFSNFSSCAIQAGISKMDGVGGKPAWAWIFILEGLITVVAGALSFWIIVDFPDNATFLNEAERTVIIRRLQGDAQFSAAGEKMSWRHIKKAMTEWKTYLCSTFTLTPQHASTNKSSSSDRVRGSGYAVVRVRPVLAEYHPPSKFMRSLFSNIY